MPSPDARRLLLVGLLGIVSSGCRDKDVPPPPPATAESPAAAPSTKRVVGPLSDADAKALKTMNDRMKSYLEIHTKLEAGLPELPKDPSPEQIDKNQRLFEQKMRAARASAKRGEIFTPEAETVIKRLLAAVFTTSQGKELMASIMDEYPAGLKLTVNGRYPDAIPVSTVPPEILQTLPKLPEDMEYRFIGRHMILLDTHAHVIADLIENALPKL
ncbi:MAG: hypothetical protein H0W08_24450 [Acidobacteria bacterium]|nr:hypothetical protein [Acidobacteriota bacterium]